eukprot:gene1137-1299_t
MREVAMKEQREGDIENDLIEQINRGNRKQKERDEEYQRRRGLLAQVGEDRGVVMVGGMRDQVDENGVIQRVDGEDEDYDERHLAGHTTTMRRQEDDDSDEEVEIVPFNLSSEKREGTFRNDGSYERGADEKEDDPWLREYDEKWSAKLAKADRERNVIVKKDDDDGDDEEEDMWQKEDEERKRRGFTKEDRVVRRRHLETIVSCLQENETVITALRRLGSGGKNTPALKKKASSRAQQQKIDAMKIEEASKPPLTPEQEQQAKQFSELTEASHALLSSGYMNVYSDKKEVIQAMIIRENPGSVAPPKKTEEEVQYEYKLEDGNIYGPFGSTTMKEWRERGCFANQVVMVRRLGTEAFNLRVDDMTL